MLQYRGFDKVIWQSPYCAFITSSSDASFGSTQDWVYDMPYAIDHELFLCSDGLIGGYYFYVKEQQSIKFYPMIDLLVVLPRVTCSSRISWICSTRHLKLVVRKFKLHIFLKFQTLETLYICRPRFLVLVADLARRPPTKVTYSTAKWQRWWAEGDYINEECELDLAWLWLFAL